jgi:trans-2,3-dihydro-3-hydroxyanthranilate isomerase
MASAGRLPFRLVNVFAESAFGGNPLCVFEDASGLDDVTLQALALQFNLSETAFILPATTATALRAVRIFTPAHELPFAGHPTLGTAHVVRSLASAGDAFALELKAGVIPVTADGDVWTLRANPPTWHVPRVPHALLAQMLGLEPSEVLDGALWVDAGSEQLIVPLASVEAVRRCRPNPQLLARHSLGFKRSGLAYVWAPDGPDTVRARFFWEKQGALLEDPGTGSACANLGGWLLAQGVELPLERTILQGDETGRPCRLHLRVDAERRIHVSGRVIEIGRGEITL